MNTLTPNEARNKLTLRQARIHNGISEVEASKRSGLPVKTILKYEEDSGPAKMHHIVSLLHVYKVSINHIYVGKTPGGNRADVALDPSDILSLREKGSVDFDTRSENLAGRLEWLAGLIRDEWQIITIDQNNNWHYRIHLFHEKYEALQDTSDDAS